jgi:hypothetical protein
LAAFPPEFDQRFDLYDQKRMTMPETLLATSSIKMYGRVVTDLQFTGPAAHYANTPNQNQFLQNQMAAGNPILARIYGLTFEGAFHTLTRPSIFLVHGPGTPIDVLGTPGHPGRSTTDESGVVAREWEFSAIAAGGPDLVFWEYEKNDILLRLDVETGPLDQILLPLTLRNTGGVSGAGVSGAGVSGAGVSGAGVSGAGVSGAGVSGAGVSGAGVSGAGVSGAGLRR